MRAPLLLAGLLVLAAAALLLRSPQTPAPAAGSLPAVEREVAADMADTPVLVDTGRGCLEPTRIHQRTGAVERSDTVDWQPTAAADRLQRDRCGSIWGLWFNSWAISVQGDPMRTGHVGLPPAGAIGRLSRSGVADFVPAPDASLWVVGRNGEVARYHAGRWQSLPAPDGCGAGDLQLFDGDMWLACGPASIQPLSRWDADAQAWRPQDTGGKMGFERLAVAEDGVRLAAGAGMLAIHVDGPEQAWRMLPAAPPSPTALAADAQRIHVGSTDGLYSFDRDGRALGHALVGERITGVVAVGDGRVWASVFGAGLRFFDGQAWHAWRYAHGLPDDDGRDLLLDDDGRLWVAGTVGGVMDANRAAARIVGLQAPTPIVGRQFTDACAAADALLGSLAASGQVARHRGDAAERVFFAGHQVCPAPWLADLAAPLFHRRADGALLELAHNGHRGSVDCGGPCSGAQQAAMADRWRLRLHLPSAGSDRMTVRTLPLPEPLPNQTPHGAVLLASDDGVWVGTRDGGLYQFDGDRWQHHLAAGRFDRQSPLRALVEDVTGGIWAGSVPSWDAKAGRHRGAALLRWHDREWQVAAGTDPLMNWSTQSLVSRAAGGIAIGANGRMAEIGGDGVRIIEQKILGQRSFVAALAEDAEGGWWIGHGLFDPGLSRLRDGELRHASSREGLFDDRIRQIAIDDEDRVWLLAADGRVAVYRREALEAALRR